MNPSPAQHYASRGDEVGPTAWFVAPSPESMGELGSAFVDLTVLTPSELLESDGDAIFADRPVVVTGVPTADGMLSAVLRELLARGAFQILLDSRHPIEAQLAEDDMADLAGYDVSGGVSVAGVPCIVLTPSADRASVPAASDLDRLGSHDVPGAGSPVASPIVARLRRRERSIVDLTTKLAEAERTIAELRRSLPASADGQRTPEPTETPRASTSRPAARFRAGRRWGRRRLVLAAIAAGAAVVAVALAIGVALATHTDYVGAMATVGVEFVLLTGAISVLLIRRAGRIANANRSALRTLQKDSAKASTKTRDRLSRLERALDSGRHATESITTSIENRVNVLAASSVNIAQTVTEFRRTLEESSEAAHVAREAEVIAQREAVTKATAVERRAMRQAQAIANLFKLVDVKAVVPPMGGWAASPDVVVLLVDELLTRRPSLVVECGSGVSTLWLALVIEHFELDCRVVALEHNRAYVEATNDLLRRHGAGRHVEVREARLGEAGVDGHDTPWYDPAALTDLHEIGLLFVDGPPETTGRAARFPAVPLLRDRLAEQVTIVLDDLVRASEREAARAWEAMLPGFSVERLDLDKGAAVFRRG